MGNTKVPLATDTQVTADSLFRLCLTFGWGFFIDHLQRCIQMNPMLPLAAMLTFSASLIAFSPNHIGWLEEATTEQCRTNDWPADKHDIHIAWCTHNGYPVK